MAGIDETKYENTILYLISRMGDRTVHGEAKLAKLLYYVDFDRFEYRESMESVTGDAYRRQKMGPLPVTMSAVIQRMQDSGQLALEEGDEYKDGQWYKPVEMYSSDRKPDLTLFDDDDRYILNRVAEEYGDADAKQLQDQTRQEAPWLSVEDGEVIPYEMAFYRGTFG